MAPLKIHSSNILYFGICLACLAAFSLVGVYPNAVTLAQMDADIAELERQTAEQQMLYPIYRQLIKEMQQAAPNHLPLPNPTKMNRDALGAINAVFSEIAHKSGVVFENAVPDALSYLDEEGYLTMTVRFRGGFFQLRDLLLNMCNLAYLHTIDHMLIETRNQEKSIVLKLRLIQG